MRNVYAIYDRVAITTIGALVVERSHAQVIRLFNDLLGDTNTQVGKHPADFDLLYLGKIADDGQLLPERPETIASGAAYAVERVLSPNMEA